MTEIEGLLIKIGADAEEAKAAFKGIQAGLDSMSSTFTSAGQLLTGAITVPLAAIGAAGLKAGIDIDSAFDAIRTKTGQTGSSLEGLQQSFRNVFGNVASSAKEVGDAIAAISSRTGQTGGGLEALTTQFLNFARVTGEALGPAIAKGTRLFGDWGVEVARQGPVMDMLFRASQQTGISFTSLAEKLVYAGAPLRQLGFSLEQAAVMMSKFEKEGVNIELVLGGMRAALAKFGKDGLEPIEAFKDLVSQIKGADAAHANLIATTMVGSKRASDFAAAIREGRLDLEGLYEAVVKGGDSINKAAQDTEDFAESWTKFKNQMTLALEPLGVSLMKILNDLAPLLQGVVGYVAAAAKAFGDLSPGTQQAIVGFSLLFAAVGPVALAIGKMIELFPTMQAGIQALGLSFAGLAKGALFAAGAIAAIEIGKAVKGWSDAQGQLGKVIEFQYKQLDQLEVTAKRYGITLDRGKMSMDEYTLALNKAIRAHPEYQAKLEANAKAQERIPPAVNASALAHQLATAATEAHRSVMSSMAAATQAAEKAHQNAAAAAKGMAAQLALSTLEAERWKKATADAAVAIERDFQALQKSLAALGPDLSQVTTNVEEFLNTMGLGASDMAAQMGTAFEDIATDSGAVTDALAGDHEQIRGEFKRTAEKGSEFERALSGIWTNFESDIASAIRSGQGFRDAFVTAANSIADAFMKQLVHGALKAVTGSLDGITKQLGGVGNLFSNLFGGGGGGNVGGNVGGQVAGGGGGIGGSAGGALGGALSGVTGIVGMVGSIGTMVSSIVANFQNARMEKTMNAIEESTRYSKGYNLQTFEFIRDWLPWLENTAQLLRLENIERALYEIGGNIAQLAGGGSQTQPLQQIYQSLETFRETTRQQLQFISEASVAIASAVNKPQNGQQYYVPNTTGGNTLVPQTVRPGGAPGNNVTVNVQQTTQNPYTQGLQIAGALNSALPALR